MDKLIFPAYLLGILLMLSGAGQADLHALDLPALTQCLYGLLLVLCGALLSIRKERRCHRGKYRLPRRI